MIMSRMTLRPQAASRLGVYEAHQALWLAFADGPERTRDFLYREMDGFGPAARGGRQFLVVSSRAPRLDQGLWDAQQKPYAPRLRRGERILFTLRVNPVRKIRDEQRRQIRLDMVEHRLQSMPEQDRPPRLAVAQEEGLTWLRHRQEALGLAVDFEACVVEAYRKWRFRKPRMEKDVVIATMDLRGFATVSDPEALVRALFHGVGPAKAFGCGLLLARRP